MMTAIEQAAKALARLSDAEGMRVRSVEGRRRADQSIVRDLGKRHRELRRIDREPAP
jgi:hypothetical protein